MTKPLPRLLNSLLEHVDNPMHEDRWSHPTQIADRAGIPRRGMANRLDKLEREGLVESMSQGTAPSMWTDPPARLWRVKR